MNKKSISNEPGAEVAVEELGEANSISSDDALLMSMGNAPQLKRVYSFWTRKLTTRPSRKMELTLFRSTCLSSYDVLQLVMPCCTLLHHLWHRRSCWRGLGNNCRNNCSCSWTDTAHDVLGWVRWYLAHRWWTAILRTGRGNSKKPDLCSRILLGGLSWLARSRLVRVTQWIVRTSFNHSWNSLIRTTCGIHGWHGLYTLSSSSARSSLTSRLHICPLWTYSAHGEQLSVVLHGLSAFVLWRLSKVPNLCSRLSWTTRVILAVDGCSSCPSVSFPRPCLLTSSKHGTHLGYQNTLTYSKAVQSQKGIHDRSDEDAPFCSYNGIVTDQN